MTLFIFTVTARIYVSVQAWHEVLAHYLHPSLANSSNPSADTEHLEVSCQYVKSQHQS